MHLAIFPCLSSVAFFALVHIGLSTFEPCPLLRGTRQPKSISTSALIEKTKGQLTRTLDQLVTTGNSSGHGPVTPNTTSFSLSLFSTAEDNMTFPYFYEYHHSAERFRSLNADSVYRAGDITKVLTVYTFLVTAGDTHWNHPVTEYVPELAETANAAHLSPIHDVVWEQVTLGDLASHMAGIGRDVNATNVPSEIAYQQVSNLTGDAPSDRKSFLSGISHRAPVVLPGSTPIYSNAAFQILAYALENITGRPLDDLLADSVITPLSLKHTRLQPPSNISTTATSNLISSGWYGTPGELPASGGLYTSLRDLSTIGKAILSSQLLPNVTTRRWLRPVSFTSNSANTVGMPWEIYNAGGDTVTPIFTKVGVVGKYSSYLGLVPDYGIGFVILAVDSVSPADLNAYADIIGDVVLPSIVEQSLLELNDTYGGVYIGGHNSSLVLSLDMTATAGLKVDDFIVNGTDIRGAIATLNGIESAAGLDIRIYPTNLQTKTFNSTIVAFRAVFQDATAFMDAGTATCISWQGIDASTLGSKHAALDTFIFESDADGRTIAVEIPALDAVFEYIG